MSFYIFLKNHYYLFQFIPDKNNTAIYGIFLMNSK